MYIRKFIILALALIFALSFVGCLDNKGDSGESTMSKEEEKIETTYDDRGNISREDHYDSDGELMYYLTYEYDENNVLTLKTEFNENGVKHSYTEYEYRENGKLFSENIIWLDDHGKQYNRDLIEYYESGNRNKLTSFDANDEQIGMQIYSESGVCILSDVRQFDELGAFVGRHVMEQTEEMLVIRTEEYDVTGKLVNRSTYSYYDNGVKKESKQINENGDIVWLTLCDEKGQETYREMNSFHDNGKMSVNDKTEYKNGITYSDVSKYSEDGELISREILESTKEGEIKNVIYGSKGEILYYKDSQRFEQTLFTEDGRYLGRRLVEYFENGEMKLEKESDSEDRITLLREYSVKGIILVNRFCNYNSDGVLVEYQNEEISESDVILKRENIKYDDKGAVIDKNIALYDYIGNVTYDERVEGGVLKYKYSAEYYGKEKLKKEESYQNDGFSVMIRSVEYDEEGRVLYQYDCHEMLDNGNKNESVYTYRYNAAGNVVYQEFQTPTGHRTVEEFYDNGQIKRSVSYDRDGNIISKIEWDEKGNTIV